MIKTSIICCVYNKWSYTKMFLGFMSKLVDHEIIIIDNASIDETKRELPRLIDRFNERGCNFKLIVNKKNEWHSRGCNQGFAISSGSEVIFINNDIRIMSNFENWTSKLIGPGLVGVTMGQLDSELDFVKEGYDVLDGNSYLGGWCLGGSRDTWNKLIVGDGVWNELFEFYFNDVDLSFRAKELGIDLSLANVPELKHFGKISASQFDVNELYVKSREKFKKHWFNRI